MIYLNFHIYFLKFFLTVDLENVKIDDLAGMDYSSLYISSIDWYKIIGIITR